MTFLNRSEILPEFQTHDGGKTFSKIETLRKGTDATLAHDDHLHLAYDDGMNEWVDFPCRE
jgi:hypothetical protein